MSPPDRYLAIIVLSLFLCGCFSSGPEESTPPKDGKFTIGGHPYRFVQGTLVQDDRDDDGLAVVGVACDLHGNGTAAAALAIARGLDVGDVAARLTSAASASRWRMELHTRADGLVVVNDAYNANPASMAAAIDAVAQIGTHRDGRTVAVLGEMLELGVGADEAHREVGRHVARSGVDWLVIVGEGAAALADGARAVPGWAGEAVVAPGRDEALALLRDRLGSDDVVLVKASRGAALELVAEGLLEGGAEDA